MSTQDHAMTDKESVELWKGVAMVFDSLLTEIRQTAQDGIEDVVDVRYALNKIIRLIGEPSHAR